MFQQTNLSSTILNSLYGAPPADVLDTLVRVACKLRQGYLGGSIPRPIMNATSKSKKSEMIVADELHSQKLRVTGFSQTAGTFLPNQKC
jgi:hypothetical protein